MKLFVRIYDLSVANSRRATALVVLAWLLVVGLVDEFAPRDAAVDEVKQQLEETAQTMGAQRATLATFNDDQKTVLSSVRNNSPNLELRTGTITLRTLEDREWRESSLNGECYSYSVKNAADSAFKRQLAAEGTSAIYACPVVVRDAATAEIQFQGTLSVSYDVLEPSPSNVFSLLRFEAKLLEAVLAKSNSF